MSFAIIETGGKQYKVSASNILKVEKLDIKKGNKVEFKKVLLVNDDKTVEIGDPTVSGAIVEGMLLDNIKDRKVIVFKKRRRQNSRKRYGHRQPLSKVQITKIMSKNGKVVAEIKALGGEAVANYDSVDSYEGGINIFNTAMDAFGAVDIVINNAGILRDKTLFNMEESDWDAIMAVHLKGHFNCTQPFVRYIREPID